MLAPAVFLEDFAAQQYGMLSPLNMKDIHDASLSFFSSQPFLICAFFFPQQSFTDLYGKVPSQGELPSSLRRSRGSRTGLT